MPKSKETEYAGGDRIKIVYFLICLILCLHMLTVTYVIICKNLSHHHHQTYDHNFQFLASSLSKSKSTSSKNLNSYSPFSKQLPVSGFGAAHPVSLVHWHPSKQLAHQPLLLQNWQFLSSINREQQRVRHVAFPAHVSSDHRPQTSPTLIPGPFCSDQCWYSISSVRQRPLLPHEWQLVPFGTHLAKRVGISGEQQRKRHIPPSSQVSWGPQNSPVLVMIEKALGMPHIKSNNSGRLGDPMSKLDRVQSLRNSCSKFNQRDYSWSIVSPSSVLLMWYLKMTSKSTTGSINRTWNMCTPALFPAVFLAANVSLFQRLCFVVLELFAQRWGRSPQDWYRSEIRSLPMILSFQHYRSALEEWSRSRPTSKIKII